MQKIIQKSATLIAFLFFVAIPNVRAQWDPTNYDDTDLPSASIEDIVSNIVMWILGLFGFIGVIGFVISGIMYLTAAGNAEQEKVAKKAMQMSIIGVVVGLVGLVVINAVDMLLGGGNGRDCGLFGWGC